LEEVIRRLGPRLLLYARDLVGDSEAAHEIVQDTFVAFWQANPEPIADHHVAWLFRVCRNKASDHLRRERRMRATEVLESDELRSREPSPPAVAEIQDEHARVLAAMEALPARQGEVLRLKLLGELSYREISQVTGLSEGNVGFLIHHAIRALRVELGAGDVRQREGTAV
jgi:RNA polymerase sigma-70 factor (ECF subfamily)